MITLLLLHPQHSTPVQSWTFENELVIRVGRATDNNVVLYSAVVSRHHAELQLTNRGWEIISLGANGTFLGDRRISEAVPVIDGLVFRLAQSGPKIQIRLGAVPLQQAEKVTSQK